MATALLPNFKLVNINRQANVVAHQIVKFCFDNRSDGFLCNSFPPLRRECYKEWLYATFLSFNILGGGGEGGQKKKN